MNDPPPPPLLDNGPNRAPPRPPANDDDEPSAPVAVNLRSRFAIDLIKLHRGEESYGFQDLRRALSEDTTTVTHLRINLGRFRPRQQYYHVFVQFLREYVMGRSHLRSLELVYGSPEKIRSFLMAAAASETIHHLRFELAEGTRLPVQDLVLFFRRAHRQHVKVLEIESADFYHVEPANSLDRLQADLSEQFPLTTLDKLALDNVRFHCKESALAFANLVSTLNIKDLELGNIDCSHNRVEYYAILYNMILHILDNSLVKRLKFRYLRQSSYTAPVLFNTALLAGKSTVEDLHVEIYGIFDLISDIFVRAFPVLTKLKTLRLHLFGNYEMKPDAKKKFFQAIDAGVTLTGIRVDVQQEEEGNSFSPQELRLLRDGRTERNATLQRFVECPPQVSQKELLVLMLQLQNCPTGRFQVARNLPKAYFEGGKQS